ncbi:MAG: hypothetical protein OXC79_05475 [Candidatus Poribacteria bacterium]|nr:hypothetical protein [Candidatus Poribacteria bacterium]
MKNRLGKHDIFGDLITQKRGRMAVPILVRCAQERRTITFQELGHAIGVSNYWRMGPILGCINTTHYNLERHADWQYADIPCITTIVITKDGEPSQWMRQELSDNGDTPISWQDYERCHIQPVFEYPHWDKVIDTLIRKL